MRRRRPPSLGGFSLKTTRHPARILLVAVLAIGVMAVLTASSEQEKNVTTDDRNENARISADNNETSAAVESSSMPVLFAVDAVLSGHQ